MFFSQAVKRPLMKGPARSAQRNFTDEEKPYPSRELADVPLAIAHRCTDGGRGTNSAIDELDCEGCRTDQVDGRKQPPASHRRWEEPERSSAGEREGREDCSGRN